MEIKNSKKGFAFTFLAFFICTIFFAYIHLSMDKSDFTKDSAYKNSRISYIDDEIKYFKKTYGRSIITYSLYNTLFALNNFSRDPVKYARLHQNYSHLNYLVGEGMYHGSFENISQNFLNGSYDGKDKTLKYFINEFKDIFYTNYRANLTFRIMEVNVYEKNPYYVSVQVFATYNITTPDNISTWNFEEYFDVSVPVYDLYDPEFLLENNTFVQIRPSERYLSSSNWTIDTFKEALDNNYTLIYHEPNYKYTLGESYLQKLLGFRNGSYKDVVGFWSFDYDEEEEEVYDSSGYSNFAKHYGNSRLLFSFDNETINGNDVYDLSDYEITGEIVGDVDCRVRGITNYSCYFDGDGDYINISKDDLNLNHTNKITISAWINPNNYTDPNSPGGDKPVHIFRYGSSTPDVISLRLGQSKKIFMEIGDHNGGSYDAIVDSTENISLNEWSHVVGSFDGDTGIGKLYVNGFLTNLNYLGEPEILTPIVNFIKSNADIGIGNHVGSTRHFNGSIDELAVYTKVLSDSDVATLYEEGKVKHMDYVESVHGKGIEFDGEDDYMMVSNEIDNIGNYSVEIWLKPMLNSNLGNNIQSIFNLYNGSGQELRFFLNGWNQLEVDVYYNDSLSIHEYGNLLSDFEVSDWQYYVLTLENDQAKLYFNGEKVYINLTSNMSINNVKNISFGAIYDMDSFSAEKYFFKGVIDEVKIYNRTLNENEVRNNYHNYKSYGKGCCNYLTMINPNSMGFNNSDYEDSVSYTSKTFFDFYNTDLNFSDMVLYNITNITSHDTTKNYYNFILDQCMAEAYNIFNYQGGDRDYVVDFVNNTASRGVYCGDLIKEGFY